LTIALAKPHAALERLQRRHRLRIAAAAAGLINPRKLGHRARLPGLRDVAHRRFAVDDEAEIRDRRGAALRGSDFLAG
jgi:hypothetical protein